MAATQIADTFSNIFEKQAENQRNMFEKGMYSGFSDNPAIDGEFTELPMDDPKLSSYHIQQLVSEIGEVLEADKRWKNFRNDAYNRYAKLGEIADCFIVLMNIAMFSGFDSEEVYNAICNKIEEVSIRISDC